MLDRGQLEVPGHCEYESVPRTQAGVCRFAAAAATHRGGNTAPDINLPPDRTILRL